MALQGAVVMCGYTRLCPGGCLLVGTVWSQALVSGQPTVKAAHLRSNESDLERYVSTLCFEVTTDHDIWIAWGENPNASKPNGDDDSARVLVRPGESRAIFCAVGDRFVSFDA